MLFLRLILFKTLQAVVPIIGNYRCQELYLKEDKPLKLSPNFICAGYEEGGVDSCHVSF